MNKIFLLITCLILFGCSNILGPKDSTPNYDPPRNWNNTLNNSTINDIDLTKLAWWKQFNDPILNELINEAIKNNNNIQVAIGNISRAKASLKKVYMSWIPSINLGIGALFGQSFDNNTTMQVQSNQPSFKAQNTMNISTDYIDLPLNYSINIFEIIKNQDMAKANVQMQTANKNSIKLSIISQVIGSYFALLALQKQQMLQKQMIKDANILKDFYRIQFECGIISKMNSEMMEQAVSYLKTQLFTINNNIIQTQNTIQVLISKNPNSIITKNNIDNIKLDHIIPINLPSKILKSRPDIMAAEYQVKNSNAKIGVATSVFFPTLSLTSAIGAATFQLGNLVNGSTDFWAAQAKATMPLLNLSFFTNIQLAKGDYYSAYYNYIQTVKSAFAEVENNLSKYQTTYKTYEEYKHSLQSANNLYSLALIQYKIGDHSLADTMNYKLDVDYNLLTLNQAKLNQLNSLITIFQSFGSGYNVNGEDEIKKFNDSHDI